MINIGAIVRRLTPLGQSESASYQAESVSEPGRALVIGPSARQLVALVVAATPDRLRVALADGGIDVDDGAAFELYGEFVAVALLFDPSSTRLATVDQVPLVKAGYAALGKSTDAASVEPGLVVEESLAGRLPCLALAAEVARTKPHGRLVVSRGWLPADTGGIYCRFPEGAAIILSYALGEDVFEAWCHELAHAIDPDFDGHVSHERELFAEALGPLFAAERPESLADAEPLIEIAQKARPTPLVSDH